MSTDKKPSIIRRMSIRQQLVAMFLIVVFPMFAAGVILLVTIRDTITDKNTRAVLDESDRIKYRISDCIDFSENLSKEIASNQRIISFLNNSFEDKSEYYAYYNGSTVSDYSSVSSQVDDIIVLSEREDFIYSSNYRFADESITMTGWYKKVILSKSGYTGVIPFPFKSENEYVLASIMPVLANDKVVGVVVSTVSEEWIRSVITDESVSLVLSGDRGKVFYSDLDDITPGISIYPDENFLLPGLRAVTDKAFFDRRGSSVVNTFSDSCNIQVIMMLPQHYMNREINNMLFVYGGYSVMLTIVSLLIIVLFTSLFSRRITTLSDKMRAVSKGNFDVKFDTGGSDEISELYRNLSQMISDMQRLIDDNYRVRLESEAFKVSQKEAEFKALASQINPHFLYNTLETIRMKAYCNKDKETAELVKKLGKFMRRCLEFKDGEVTLYSELEFTDSYLELQIARFGDRVSYSIYSEVSKDYMILPLIIQPIVENAFVHGIESNKSNGRIDIKIYYSGELVIVDVTDNGQGMSHEKLWELEKKLEISDTSSGKSIGLTNVHKRIKMFHGEKYGLSVKSIEGKGTTIRIALPRYPAPRLSINEKTLLTEGEEKKNV